MTSLNKVQSITKWALLTLLLLTPFSQTVTAAEDEDVLAPYLPIDIEGHWAEEVLNDFVDADVIKGYVNAEGEVTVRPNQSITRAEFITLLVKGMGLTNTTVTAGKTFSDVKPEDWHYTFIQIAIKLDIATGVSDTEFAPNKTIKRDEMATMVVNAFANTITFDGEAKVFKDVPEYWGKPFIDKASKAGIISGYGEDLFMPTGLATRAEALSVLNNAIQEESNAAPEDTLLTDIVLNSEAEMTEALNEMNVEQMEAINEKYSLGYYKAMTIASNSVIKDLIDEGFTISTELKGDLKAEVLAKSNRYAVVELTGASYNVTMQKDDFNVSNVEYSSGLLYLRNVTDATGNAEWKIYGFYQVTE